MMDELMRGFHSKEAAMMCALRHGQVTIDGYIIRPGHLDRWTPEQLWGRYARLAGRYYQLYGSAPVRR